MSTRIRECCGAVTGADQRSVAAPHMCSMGITGTQNKCHRDTFALHTKEVHNVAGLAGITVSMAYKLCIDEGFGGSDHFVLGTYDFLKA